MRGFFLWIIAIALWVGSIFGWGAYADAQSAWNALGPSPSNAEIYPIENKLLLGFVSGLGLSFAAMIVAAFAGARAARK